MGVVVVVPGTLELENTPRFKSKVKINTIETRTTNTYCEMPFFFFVSAEHQIAPNINPPTKLLRNEPVLLDCSFGLSVNREG